MKTLMKTLMLPFVALAMFALVSCSNVSPNAPSTPSTPTAQTLTTAEFRTVQNFINAINANDRNAALALVSDNAGYAYSLTGSLNTGTSFRNWLESDLFAPRAVIQIETATQDGNVVRIQGRWGRNGNATSRADYYFTVANGLITAWRLV